ncbi:MAG: type II toxin-antitoxin system RelE/ParE family toxin [Chloroflexota bacterium]
MPYSLKLHRDIEKQLQRMSLTDRERVVEAVRSLRVEPRPAGCIHLEENLYRVRVGDYRIIYAVFDTELVVLVCKVARRTETTYRQLKALATRPRREVGRR